MNDQPSRSKATALESSSDPVPCPPRIPPAPEAPPILASGPPPTPSDEPDFDVAGWRYAASAMLLAGYVLAPVGFHVFQADESDGPLLASDLSTILFQILSASVLFLIVFIGAWFLARPGRGALYLAKPLTVLSVALGFLWSWALRFGVAGVVIAVVYVPMAIRQLFQPDRTFEVPQGLRPEVENMLNLDALFNPWYLLFMMTGVSFLFAGLREELWRAGIIAALIPLMRPWFNQEICRRIALLLSSCIFGLAHLPGQGWGGVFMTTALGLGLGAILIYRRSLAEAALAHGFFDATSFALIRLFASRTLWERLGVDPEIFDQVLGR